MSSPTLAELENMSSQKRNFRLCQLVVKESMMVATLEELCELELIQKIRKENGEIDKVLKGWKDDPENDPRNW